MRWVREQVRSRAGEACSTYDYVSGKHRTDGILIPIDCGDGWECMSYCVWVPTPTPAQPPERRARHATAIIGVARDARLRHLELAVEESAGQPPVTLDRALGDAERLGGVLDRQTREEAQLDDLPESRVGRFEAA